jgi:uridine phosphorylase
MTKRTAEDLVAEWEKSGVATVNLDELKALCASWRERGAMIDAIHAVLNEHDGDDAVGHIRDVLYGGAEI